MEKKMATKQADGVTDVTATSTKNNNGTIKANGNVASGVVISQNTVLEDVGVFASTVIDNNSADKALVAGTFAYDNERPVAKKLTTSLSGVENDVLLSGASDPSNIRSIHKLEVVRTRRQTSAIRSGNFNDFTGKFDSGYPVNVVDEFYDVSTNTLSETSTDNAATPTRQVPGELTYLVGVAPVNADYPKKTC
jgi:hypothetical protein